MITRLNYLSFLLVILLIGCAGPSHIETNYYQLTPVSDETTYPYRKALVIAPVTIPEALKRKAIVSYGDDKSSLILPNSELWAGDLRELILDVVEYDLQLSFPDAEVTTFNSHQNRQSSLKLDIQIQELAGKLGEYVNLSAHWQITDKNDALLIQRRSEHKMSLDDGSYTTYVAAMSELIGHMSEEIARAISQQN